jgi:LacI family transcriptional regulator
VSINISDVAEHAGVSIATVSRIINNLPGYSAKTKERVEKAIEELGYKPNAVARGLVSNKTGTIGVLLPCVTGRFSSDVFCQIEFPNIIAKDSRVLSREFPDFYHTVYV